MTNAQLNPEEAQFSFSQFKCAVKMNNKENTLRTWLKRYFPDVGEKMPNGKMKFSAIDCIAVRFFSELTTELSLPPETARLFAMACVVHFGDVLAGSLEVDKQDPNYFVASNASGKGFLYEVVKTSVLASLISKDKTASFIIVPVDTLLASIENMLFQFAQYNESTERMKRMMRPMSAEDMID